MVEYRFRSTDQGDMSVGMFATTFDIRIETNVVLSDEGIDDLMQTIAEFFDIAKSDVVTQEEYNMKDVCGLCPSHLNADGSCPECGENNKTFDVSTEQGIIEAERFKSELENVYHGVVTEKVGEDKVRIYGHM